MGWWVKKNEKICATLNYIEHFLILAFTITGCVSISVFASSIRFPIGITSSASGLKICEITARIKKYNSIIKKKKKKHNKIVSLGKSKLNWIICKSLIDLNINHNEFFLVNNLLKEYEEMKEEIKYLKT